MFIYRSLHLYVVLVQCSSVTPVYNLKSTLVKGCLYRCLSEGLAYLGLLPGCPGAILHNPGTQGAGIRLSGHYLKIFTCCNYEKPKMENLRCQQGFVTRYKG